MAVLNSLWHGASGSVLYRSTTASLRHGKHGAELATYSYYNGHTKAMAFQAQMIGQT